jgi:hypothetical protein
LDISTKDAISDIEKNLRKFVNSVLERKYGNWEDNTNIGWSKGKKEELEGRRRITKEKSPNQNLSSKLLDYSYILDLKYLVDKNRKHFEEYIPNWNETSCILDLLSKYRNTVFHREGDVLPHQHHFCLGLCGELNLLINRSKYSRYIISYSCYFRFDELQGQDAERAKKVCKGKSEAWLRAITNKLEVSAQIEPADNLSISLKEGKISLSSLGVSRTFIGGEYNWSSNVRLTSTSIDAINRILSINPHPYYQFEWNLATEINLTSLESVVESNTRLTPTSKSDNTLVYYITQFGSQKRIRFDLTNQSSLTTTVRIVYDDAPPIPFIKAHMIFSPDLILSILRGDISPIDVNDMINNCCNESQALYYLARLIF